MKRTRLLVRAEQGVGDQIMFVSLIPDLLARAEADGGRVILECEPRLVPLARAPSRRDGQAANRSRPSNGIATADYGWLKAAGGANAVTLMGILPRCLRAMPGCLSQAARLPDAGPAGAKRAGAEKFAESGRWTAIGICWRSGKIGRPSQRAICAAGSLGRIPARPAAARIVSCQYDATAEEIAALEAISGRKIFVPPGLDQKNELDRTAAMLSALDMLVSAPTAVSWLGAGAGHSHLEVALRHQLDRVRPGL